MSQLEQEPAESQAQSPLLSVLLTHFSALVAVSVAAIAWLTTGSDVFTRHAESLQMIGFFAALSVVCSVASQAIQALAMRATHSTLGLVLLLAGCNILKHLLMVCVLLFTLVIWRSP
jgi:hypothetical protein